VIFVKMEEVGKLGAELEKQYSLGGEEMVRKHLRSIGFESGAFYQELEMTSRYVDTHQDISVSNSRVSLHSHNFFEILCCQNTCDVEYLVGAERYRLQKGDVVIIPPGVSHRPLLPEHMAEPYRRDVMWLSQELVATMPHLLPEEGEREPRLLRTAGTQWEFLSDLFRNGVRESEQRRVGWEEAVLGNTIQVLVYIRRALDDHTATPLRVEQPELLDRVLAYVEEHLAQKITLADVAKHFWVSQSTIGQIFRSKLGVSFYRCVTQRRLIAAKGLILQGLPLEQVNEKVGFTDYSTFYRAFKQEFGISPRQYRKLQETSEHTLA
jgi:AraC-like DNA-binding protein